jgi:hypothetical protein
MATHSETWKCCSTCEFWCGPRKPDSFLSSVQVANGAKGVCAGQWKGSTKEEGASCSGWKRWGVLK